MIIDLVDHLLGGRTADFRHGARTETLGDGNTHLDEPLGPRRHERLAIGVGADKLHALEARSDHVVDGVATRAADPEDRDLGLQLSNVRHLQVDRHGTLVV